MKDIYSYWNTDTVLRKYGRIPMWKDGFRSEIHFLEKIGRPGMSVLDIGCGTGGLYHRLKEKWGTVSYTGVDVAPKLIERAQSLARAYSGDAIFIEGNIFDVNPTLGSEKFDIVNATGVFQHEPRTGDLLALMTEHTKEGGYMLFDVKLFHSHSSVCDISRGYLDHPNRIYYIVFNIRDFADIIHRKISFVESAEMYGYYAGMHEKVRLPPTVREDVCSAHVFLRHTQKKDGTRSPALFLQLPEAFPKKIY